MQADFFIDLDTSALRRGASPDMTYAERRTAALELMKRVHAGQKRAGDVPVWHHLDRVSQMLEVVLGQTEEGTQEERDDITLAALGHDSIEDTNVTPEELQAAFGPSGVALIEGMTNRFGDNHPEPYVAQVAAADEGTRLIKLSDLMDNCTSVTYCLPWLGVEWCHDYFLPIVTPMIKAVSESEFTRFPKAAAFLKEEVRVSFAVLRAEIERRKTDAAAGDRAATGVQKSGPAEAGPEEA